MKRALPLLCKAVQGRPLMAAHSSNCLHNAGSCSTSDRCISGRFCSTSASLSSYPRLSSSTQCWKCNQTSCGGFFCAHCDAIQAPVNDADYFVLLGVPEGSYDLDVGSLERAYRTLQSRLHPDKYAMGSEKEQAYSAEASSLVNKAYSTLKSPLQRASYMLRQQGIGADETEGTIDDPELLMEMMEAREAVDEANDTNTLEHLQTQYVEEQQACLQELSSAFSRGDHNTAYQAMIRLRYLRRILDAVDDKL